MSKDLIKILRDEMGQPSCHSRQIKTQEEISDDIHNITLQHANQMRWLRWILSGVIVFIAFFHLGILYYFLDKAGNANIKLYGYFLSDKVLIAFLGTTTADVFILIFILARFLFPDKKPSRG